MLPCLNSACGAMPLRQIQKSFPVFNKHRPRFLVSQYYVYPHQRSKQTQTSKQTLIFKNVSLLLSTLTVSIFDFISP